MSKSIGIDLGTTNSVAGIKKVHTEIITNAEGDRTTPSCVTVKKKKGLLKLGNRVDFVVGRHALEWIKQDPQNTVTAIKRLMGRSFDNPEVQNMIESQRQRYEIARHSRGTTNSLAVIVGGREYTPEQISAIILEKIKADSAKVLKDDVDAAVITVPAYFNDKQKHATRTAAAAAGLKVRRLLPEPTAAAISFGVDTVKGDAGKTVLIFDFGGGTFDLSVLTISGGQFIEQGKGGNMWLGGEDIDEKISDYVLEETAREHDVNDIQALIDSQDEDVRNRFWGEMKTAVERAKISLSEAEEAYIEILGLLRDEDGDRLDVDVELTRDRFEDLIAPMIASTIDIVRKLMADIHFTPDLIDNVLLVGGTSCIPAIGKALEQEFGPSKVLLHERPMLAIAEGAAILSHRLSDSYECPQCGRTVSQTDSRCSSCDFDLDAHIIEESVFDVVHAVAHDYYIKLENEERYLLIEKNTPLPCEQTEVFKLVHPDQKLVHLKFLNIVNDAEESIGDLWLGIDEIEDPPEESLSVAITLKIDENNLVEVAVVLGEFPDVELSRTLSRGKADEKLFLSLEAVVDEANEKEYDDYVIIDLTSRVLSIVKDIHKVIDPKTGETIDPVYELAKMKIDKAGKMAAQDLTSKPVIYYAKDLLGSFGAVIPSTKHALIRRRIDRLEDADENGTFEENLDAYNNLDRALEDLDFASVLMQIKKAGGHCEEHEPAKAAKFFNAIEDILKAAMSSDMEKARKLLTRIVPQAAAITNKYDAGKGTLYKDIRR